MVFPTRKARFLIFLSTFNEKLLKKNLNTIIPLDFCLIPTLDDGWLSGITPQYIYILYIIVGALRPDGEGSFTCSLLSNSSAFRFRFILTQKWEANKYIFEHLVNILNKYSVEGSVVAHHADNVWELRVNGLKNCKGLFVYFDNYNLMSKKKYSYLKWKSLYNRLVDKDHLNNDTSSSRGGACLLPRGARLPSGETRLELINLAKQINKVI